jgi:hypothetical protein
MHVSALAEYVRIASDPATESATQHDGGLPDWLPGTDEVWRRRRFADVRGSALRHPPRQRRLAGRRGPR